MHHYNCHEVDSMSGMECKIHSPSVKAFGGNEWLTCIWSVFRSAMLQDKICILYAVHELRAHYVFDDLKCFN